MVAAWDLGTMQKWVVFPQVPAAGAIGDEAQEDLEAAAAAIGEVVVDSGVGGKATVILILITLMIPCAQDGAAIAWMLTTVWELGIKEGLQTFGW